MTGIHVGTYGISRNNLKRHYLKNKKNFSEFFIAFLKCAWNFEHLEENDEYRCLIFQKIIDPERSGYLNV